MSPNSPSTVQKVIWHSASVATRRPRPRFARQQMRMKDDVKDIEEIAFRHAQHGSVFV
jgi:hypothetical protein